MPSPPAPGNRGPTARGRTIRPDLPTGSHGRANRQAIATREGRLRAVEHAYRTALDRDDVLTATPHARALRVADHVPDWEMEPDLAEKFK